jgi:hypothetical protein
MQKKQIFNKALFTNDSKPPSTFLPFLLSMLFVQIHCWKLFDARAMKLTERAAPPRSFLPILHSGVRAAAGRF